MLPYDILLMRAMILLCDMIDLFRCHFIDAIDILLSPLRWYFIIFISILLLILLSLILIRWYWLILLLLLLSLLALILAYRYCAIRAPHAIISAISCSRAPVATPLACQLAPYCLDDTYWYWLFRRFRHWCHYWYYYWLLFSLIWLRHWYWFWLHYYYYAIIDYFHSLLIFRHYAIDDDIALRRHFRHWCHY
jgi:hypothetical protein